jgi:Fic family protein
MSFIPSHLHKRLIYEVRHFSARIEGNPLGLSDISTLEMDSREIHTLEIGNLVKAYENITDLFSQEVSIDTLKKTHAVVLSGISPEAGKLRLEDSAIFNQAGVAVYLPPAWQNIRELLEALCIYINTSNDPSPIAAAVSHIWYEKIHPFIDGNGRVGRLLSSYILKKRGYDFSGLVPFEQYLDENRDDYYYFLGKDKQDVTGFVEFYLSALLSQARITLSTVHEAGKLDKYAHLLPRRAEIMHIIEDHKIISFDFLARRFRAIPTRTLHFDLAQLIKAGLVQKMGATRGVVYTLKK